MPRSGQVEVWVADLSRVPDSLQRLLSRAELARAQHIRNDRARRRWLASRAVLRDLLAKDIGADPTTIELQLGPHRKPRLACSAGEAVRFNLSHSGTLGLYAICADREVGVDVEQRDVGVDVELLGRRGKRRRDEVAIAGRMLGETIAGRLRALAGQEREDEFLRSWVSHEALAKCLGVGIGGMRACREHGAHHDTWVAVLDVGEAAFAALAVQGGPVEVKQRVWAPAPVGE
jgi:4'-phosphopantetheinyl transferase